MAFAGAGESMQLAIGGLALFALLNVAGEALAQDQGDCAPAPRRGIVGRIDESVTQPIQKGNCSPTNADLFPPCKSLRLEYNPSAVPYRKHGRANLTYEPQACNRPAGNP